MPTTRELAELFRAIAAEDSRAATTIAARVCRREDAKGHRAAARVLRGALHANGFEKLTRSKAASPAPDHVAEIASTALVPLPANVRLTDVVLSSSARRELQGVVLEWRHRSRLLERGIVPRSKLLFYGPPGCGKSFTARALAKELSLPIFVVRFDAVIGAYLGQTALHLRQLFHFAESTSCVLLFDELDALAKRRGSPLDVGELDRIVIALMQELEHAVPKGLIIGTSNLPKHLDAALWRRFDLPLIFSAPTRERLGQYAKGVASARKISLSPPILRDAMNSRSFAGAEAVVIDEARKQILRDL